MGNNVPKEPLSKESNDNEKLEALNALLLHEPNNVEAVTKRAVVKYNLKDYEGALEDWNRAHEIHPNNPFTLLNRGETKQLLGDYKGAHDDWKRSLATFDRIDERLPNNAYILQHRGATKRMLGDYQGALEDLNRADEVLRNNAFILEHRAIVRYHLNDFLKAFDDITLVLKLCPNNRESLEWKRKIEEKIELSSKAEEIQVNGVQQLDASPASPSIQESVIQVPFSELKVIKTLIGEGGFGEVSLAEWRGINVALKKLKLEIDVDDMSHEAKTLTLFRYKFIVVLMGFTTDPTTNNTILIMEYMKHGSLEDLLFKQRVKLSRASVIRLALDIALGVNYLHSHTPQVLHRDLKSANVLLYRNKTRAKIADFGTAKFLHPDIQATTAIGNASIAMPPEMIAEEPYDEKVDVFAFGVVLYEMLTNKRLPQLEESHRIKRICENVALEFVRLRDLVLACCASDPNKRPQMREVVDLLKKMKNESM